MLRYILSLLLLAVVSSHAQLSITEFVASNSNGLQDELGNEEDWLEIQNTSGGTVNLTGWYLSDEALNLRKWPMPAWTLAAGNRMVVFASNRNKSPVQTTAGSDNAGSAASPRVATNFKISASAGGYLALSQDSAGGTIITAISSYVSYTQQVANVAYGLSVNTTALVGAASAAKALVPTVGNGGDLLGTTWRGGSEPFADGAWTSGTPGVGVAGTATVVGAANLKLRLNANDAAGLVTDTSGTAKTTTNTTNTTIFMPSATDTQAAAVLRRGALQFDQAVASQVTVASSPDENALFDALGRALRP